MAFRDEILQYMDSGGLVHGVKQPGEISQNGILFTSLYYLQLVRQGLARTADLEKFVATIRKCEVKPGLYKRDPRVHYEQEGPDDYTGLAAASWFMKAPFAEEIIAYGESHAVDGLLYVFNNECPDSFKLAAPKDKGKINVSAWLGRMPALINHFYFAAGRIPSSMNCALGAEILVGNTFFQGMTSNWILAWLMFETAGERSWFYREGRPIWKKQLLKQFPGGMKDVLKTYFKSEPGHPLVKYFLG